MSNDNPPESDPSVPDGAQRHQLAGAPAVQRNYGSTGRVGMPLRDLVDITYALLNLQGAISALVAIQQNEEIKQRLQPLLNDIDRRTEALTERMEQRTKPAQ